MNPDQYKTATPIMRQFTEVTAQIEAVKKSNVIKADVGGTIVAVNSVINGEECFNDVKNALIKTLEKMKAMYEEQLNEI